MAPNPIFDHFFLFFGYFLPIFWGRPKPIFFLFFFHFGPEARKPLSSRRAGSQHMSKSGGSETPKKSEKVWKVFSGGSRGQRPRETFSFDLFGSRTRRARETRVMVNGLPRNARAAAEFYYQNSYQSRFSGVYLAIEVFQGREFMEMLAVFYVVLQACISFGGVSDKSGTFLFLPCSHKKDPRM